MNDTYSAFSGHHHPARHRKRKNKTILCSNTNIRLKITVAAVCGVCVCVCVCVCRLAGLFCKSNLESDILAVQKVNKVPTDVSRYIE